MLRSTVSIIRPSRPPLTTMSIYPSIQLPWSSSPSNAETAYRNAGLVRTKGTVFLLPPEQDVLVDAFSACPRPKSRMSAGAVALCKHFERGGSSAEHGILHPYWPLPRGSNENKSETAKITLDRMLHELAWRNMMMLHPGVAVYEIRNHLGYGMRWTLKIEPAVNTQTTAQTIDAEISVAETGLPQSAGDVSSYVLKEVTFRGFLEPIIGLDHELPVIKGTDIQG